jgi:hypothetical protein
VLVGGVPLDELGQFIEEGRADRIHPIEIRLAQPHRELVRNEDAIAGDDDGFRVEFPPQRARDFHRLQTTLKGLGEGTVYCPLKTSFEVVQKAQCLPVDPDG